MTLSSALPCVLSRTIGSIVGSSLSWGCIYVPTPNHFCDIFAKLSIPHSFRSWNLAYICDCQCWTVAAFFTFARSRMFSPKKLRLLAVGRSRSRRIKKCEYKSFDHSSFKLNLWILLEMKTAVHHFVLNLT